MMSFLLGGAIGYVLGTKAGRERYEQLQRAGRELMQQPTVQKAVDTAKTKSREMFKGAREDRVPEQRRTEVPEPRPGQTVGSEPAPGAPGSRPGTASGARQTPTPGPGQRPTPGSRPGPTTSGS